MYKYIIKYKILYFTLPNVPESNSLGWSDFPARSKQEVVHILLAFLKMRAVTLNELF